MFTSIDSEISDSILFKYYNDTERHLRFDKWINKCPLGIQAVFQYADTQNIRTLIGFEVPDDVEERMQLLLSIL